jgi:Flp pilus assembly protein CpaB
MGSTLTAEMLVVRNVPEEAVPSLHYGFTEQVIGQVTLYPLAAGEAILPGKLMGGSGGPLAQRCPSGNWCVSIPADWFIAAPPDLAEGDPLEIAVYALDEPL